MAAASHGSSYQPQPRPLLPAAAIRGSSCLSRACWLVMQVLGMETRHGHGGGHPHHQQRLSVSAMLASAGAMRGASCPLARHSSPRSGMQLMKHDMHCVPFQNHAASPAAVVSVCHAACLCRCHERCQLPAGPPAYGVVGEVQAGEASERLG